MAVFCHPTGALPEMKGRRSIWQTIEIHGAEIDDLQEALEISNYLVCGEMNALLEKMAQLEITEFTIKLMRQGE